MLLFVLLACGPGGVVLKGTDGDSGADPDTADSADTADSGDTGDTGPVDDGSWDDARLVVTAPASGSFLPWSEPATFAAEVLDADGAPTGFDDIVWTSDIDPDWTVTGASVEDAGLDVGTHALTATARLPNGDRLASTVGGILVQSAYTGVYTGTLTVNVTYDTYTVGCSGAATLVVDAYGETITGDAGCVLSLQGYEVDSSFLFDLVNEDGTVSGVSGADLYITTYDFETAGSIDEDGTLQGSFAGDVYGFLYVEGGFEAERVSRDISGY